MMTCKHATRVELSAYVDGELPPDELTWWDAHLTECPVCRNQAGRLQRLRQSVRSHLPPREPSSALRDGVRRLIQTHAAEIGRAPRESAPRTWVTALAASIVLMGIGFGLGRTTGRDSGGESLLQQLVAEHVRSLQADHLVDIASSEHHVVKPWFTGKLDFSPPVPDLAAEGFPLTGARLDYLADRPVAALVYGHGPHVINLLVWPSGAEAGCRVGRIRVQQGFNLVDGHVAGMQFWAVSDVNQVELTQFADRWRRSAAQGDPRCA